MTEWVSVHKRMNELIDLSYESKIEDCSQKYIFSNETSAKTYIPIITVLNLLVYFCKILLY